MSRISILFKLFCSFCLSQHCSRLPLLLTLILFIMIIIITIILLMCLKRKWKIVKKIHSIRTRFGFISVDVIVGFGSKNLCSMFIAITQFYTSFFSMILVSTTAIIFDHSVRSIHFNSTLCVWCACVYKYRRHSNLAHSWVNRWINFTLSWDKLCL